MKKSKSLLLVLCLVLCLVYLRSRTTYTAYRNQIDGNFSLPLSKWEIKVDKKSIISNQAKEITINDVEWDSTHTRKGKVALGSKGTINVEIDPTDTGVAIIYKFNVIDKSQDAEKILTLNYASSDNTTIIKTGINEYTGIISLDDIKNKKKPIIKFNVEWKDDGDYIFDPNDTSAENFLLMDFNASQYRGQEIKDYTVGLNISMVNKFTWSEPYYSMLVYSAGASTVRNVTGQTTLFNWTYIKVENGVVTDIVGQDTNKGDLDVPALGSSNNSFVILSYESTASQVGVGSKVNTPDILEFSKYNMQTRPSSPYGKINIDKKE